MKLYMTVIFILFVWLLSQHSATPAHAPLAPDEHQALQQLLGPSIRQAVSDYYGQRKGYSVIRVSRPSPAIVTVELSTFQRVQMPPFGFDLITFRIDPVPVHKQATPELIRYLHKGDEWEHKVERFRSTLINELLNAFQLNNDDRTSQPYKWPELQYQAETNRQLRPLVSCSERVMNQYLPQYDSGYKNTLSPAVLLNETKRLGYMLLKQTDGTNIAIKLRKDRLKGWLCGSAEQKPGQPMAKELLWYME
ncbi:DUF3888 domain-containing protein [Paenibacillus radicis (ex Gao et al. 2016)]|uniref:DUF3888 domain-containing protein n=1 Tax=Paenibacillus radicis (ex Gao et al. 2016) TaxID=1737354 RepID=A0A917HES7_9BACL|nr:DUF3888 domain-containing protein [Paenibacillus radicis (ex Gao et al. 2016)]GGG76840.1 hypothetical protein GCM10010918_36750 [Paenibacillus radicis (ex Gao et al. 2016)]